MAEFSRRSSGEEAEEQACSNNFVMNEDVPSVITKARLD